MTVVNGLINIFSLDNSSEMRSFKAHNVWVYNLLSVDKTKLISSSRLTDKKIKIWNLETLECIKELEGHSAVIRYLDLVSNDNLLSCSDDKTVKLWHIESGEMLKSIQFDYSVFCVKLLSNDFIAAGLCNGEIVIYDLNKMENAITILAHSKVLVKIKTLNLLSNGDLLCGSDNGEIKIFNLFK